MFTIEGQEVICLGDSTSHGGKVVSASGTFFNMGRQVARVGDKVSCPKCKGVHEIVSGAPTAFEDGKRIARNGDKVSCGATLIAGSGSGRAVASGVAEAPVTEEDPCAYVTQGGHNAKAPQEVYDNKRNEVTPLGEPEKGQASFGGREPEPVLRYKAKVNGTDIDIITPDTDQGREWAESLNNSLGLLPPELSQQTGQIVLSPYPHPEDTLRVDAEGNRRGTATMGDTSYGMQNGELFNDITFYPMAQEQGLDYVLLHEVSHPKIGLNALELSDDWEKIAAEEAPPSGYAKEHYTEDFCESNALYQAAKGTECEEVFAENYPKRYERLEKLYTEGK